MPRRRRSRRLIAASPSAITRTQWRTRSRWRVRARRDAWPPSTRPTRSCGAAGLPIAASSGPVQNLVGQARHGAAEVDAGAGTRLLLVPDVERILGGGPLLKHSQRILGLDVGHQQGPLGHRLQIPSLARDAEAAKRLTQ